ncbi:MAG: amidase [Burkholderiaceae bacterium]
MPFIHDTAQAFMPYPNADVPSATTGPLSGLNFAAKDLFDVAGYPTSGGQPFVLAMSGIKSRNAATVDRLLQAGARFVGKTVTDEFAFSMNGQNAHFGSPVNGAVPDRISGGSSSGSASAVSNGLCDFALGTDTGGSVRAPANHCGLFGLRPSHGRVSLVGAMDLAPSFDSCGWFTRDIGTFARVADVLLGQDENPLPHQPKVGWPQDVWDLLAPEVTQALAPAQARVAAILGQPTVLPAGLLDFEAMYWNFRYLQSREAWQVDGGLIERFKPPLGPGVAQRFAWSKSVTDEQVAGAQAFREQFRAKILAVLGPDGVMLVPTMPDVAPLISQSDEALEDYRNKATRMLCIAGLCGLPQLSMPMATRLGAPLGLSLMGPPGSDRSLVRLAQRILAS